MEFQVFAELHREVHQSGAFLPNIELSNTIYIYIYNLCSREKVIFPPVLISGWQDRLATIIDAQRKKIIPMTGSINRVHIHGLLPSLPPPRLPSLSPSLLENEQASFDLCNFNPIGCSIEHKREEALGRGP